VYSESNNQQIFVMKLPLHPLRIACAALAGWALLAQPLAAQGKHVRVWILSGQSNMGGGAQIQPYGNPPQEGDIWYRRSVAPDPGSDEWTPLSDVISRGVESRFGERMAEEFPDDIIALLKCNRGGSGLGPWLPGGEFYATMMGRLDAVESDLNARVQSGEISGWSYDGYLWMQGETEAALAAAGWPAEQYIRSLEQLVATMRERTGVPDLPFVLGRIYDFGLHQAPEHGSTWPNLINVRYAQEYYPLIDPRSAWLNTDDLAMSMTEPHYHSYEEMGHRFAHGFMNIHNGAQLPFRPHRVAPGAGGPIDWQPISLARTPGDGQVMLDWSHALHADTYSIHYGTAADALTQSVTGITGNQVTVTGLQNGVTYYFAARSHNAAGSSPFTEVVSAAPNGSTSGTPFVWRQDLKRTLFLPPAVSPTPAYAEVLEIHQTLQLDGTVRDDSPGLGVTWSVVSGTGTVTFGDANAIDTTATFSATGRYFLRLTASDGARSASHDLEVNVIAPSPTRRPRCRPSGTRPSTCSTPRSSRRRCTTPTAARPLRPTPTCGSRLRARHRPISGARTTGSRPPPSPRPASTSSASPAATATFPPATRSPLRSTRPARATGRLASPPPVPPRRRKTRPANTCSTAM
jgi:hypothetical protein